MRMQVGTVNIWRTPEAVGKVEERDARRSEVASGVLA